VYAANTADQMLAGKQFLRAVRGLTLAYEALMQLLFTVFLEWCEKDETRRIPAHLWHHLEDMIATFQQGTKQQKVNAVKEFNELLSRHIMPNFQQFRNQQSQMSPTVQYWSNFFYAVQILLCSIRAEREGDWDLHLASQLAMTPYFFATHHYNYSRWMPSYLLDMTHLPEDVQKSFQDGQFTIRRTAGSFNGIWSDMGTE
jgi:hypothetical protein